MTSYYVLGILLHVMYVTPSNHHNNCIRNIRYQLHFTEEVTEMQRACARLFNQEIAEWELVGSRVLGFSDTWHCLRPVIFNLYNNLGDLLQISISPSVLGMNQQVCGRPRNVRFLQTSWVMRIYGFWSTLRDTLNLNKGEKNRHWRKKYRWRKL